MITRPEGMDDVAYVRSLEADRDEAMEALRGIADTVWEFRTTYDGVLAERDSLRKQLEDEHTSVGDSVQHEIDIKNLRFYAEMFRQHEWGTVVIHWSVFEQTLKEIASRMNSLRKQRDELLVALEGIVASSRNAPDQSGADRLGNCTLNDCRCSNHLARSAIDHARAEGEA